MDAEHPALENINLTIPSNKITAIVGKSGAGMSTLLDLIPRLILPTSGVIKIDDININDLSLASLRKNIAFVYQDSILYDASIKENIKYFNMEASESDFEEAWVLSGVKDFIDKLPGKYEYNVFLEVLNLKLGEASLSINNPVTINDVNVYHLSFNVRTTRLGDTIYKIRNKIDVWIDQKSLNVVKQDKNIRELRKKKSSKTIIKDQKGVTNGQEFIVVPNAFDPYSLILILSEFDIKENESKQFNIVDAGKNRIIEVKNLGIN